MTSPLASASRLLLLSIPLAAVAPPLAAGGARRVQVSSDFAASVEDGKITVEARPIEGENPIEFAKRVSADDATAQKVLLLPGGLTRERFVSLNYAGLSSESKKAAIKALFPSDVRATVGWIHIAVEDEPLDAIATWFTGSPAAVAALAKENGLAGAVVTRGTTVRIPVELLLPPFRDAEPIPDVEPPRLEFGEDEKGRFAIYRLRKKEALYSAVVVRFTGRLHAEDVIQAALKIAIRSGIDDVHAIPVGYPVKIPIEEVMPEFLPEDDPRALALVKEKAEATQFAPVVRSTELSGIRVVVDAGHGGRDTGTLQGGVWESTYVYDVACRLRRILAERTLAEVVMTTRDRDDGFLPREQDHLGNNRRQVLLTTPPYALDDPVVGVNLRWYLANSLLKRPGTDKRKIPPEKTVFISIHADSLHPSVRGAMAYVPGERFLRDRYGKSADLYRNYKEWRDEPVVSFNKKERVASEGVSTVLAEKVLGAMRRAGLPIHAFSPVRTHVIRGGREWVPAVLRYNRIPARVLLEISNLASEDDRALTLTRGFRERVAESIAKGIVEFFGGEGASLDPAKPSARPLAPRPKRETKRAAREPENRQAAPAGPWPEAIGPLPEIAGPWPEMQGPISPKAPASPR